MGLAILRHCRLPDSPRDAARAISFRPSARPCHHALNAALCLRASSQHLNLRNFQLGDVGRAAVAAALAGKRSLSSLRLFQVGLKADGLALLLRGNTTLKTLDVSGNPELGNEAASADASAAADAEVGGGAAGAASANNAGATLARFLAGNPSLRSLSAARCALPPSVGLQLANGLADRIADEQGTGDGLRTLELSENKFDAPTGHTLAAVLELSTCLVEFNCAGNPMSAAAFKAIHDAKAAVSKAYFKTEAGKKEAKKHGKPASAGGAGTAITDLLMGFS